MLCWRLISSAPWVNYKIRITFLLIKYIVGSGDPKSSLSYTAIGLFLSISYLLTMCLCTILYLIITHCSFLALFHSVSMSCVSPLTPNLSDNSDGSLAWAWFCLRVFLFKGSCFYNCHQVLAQRWSFGCCSLSLLL